MANWQTDGCRKDELEVSNSYSMHILRARNLSKYYAYALITNTRVLPGMHTHYAYVVRTLL